MKVLFAVNSESISDAIIKKYQKDYREILSYKNVYYFNAILKEIQRDKTYDRIIISEDLEPFSNNNYESIDKFIFEKLDGISDEAHDSQGNEISIILICSDRHTKGSSFLVKLFGISVYNALLGNDRSMEEVCRLINKPRTKKEAKMYYKIDTDDVNYRAENENEVSELEIQNIIAHFKKLGKNAEKYASSFENIAEQYTDEQLKIIINCLPMNVKATLEENSPKYQEIMSVTGGMVKGVKTNTVATREDQKRTGLKIDIIENKLNQKKITQPIVIPNSVKSARSATAKKVVAIPQNPQTATTQQASNTPNRKVAVPKMSKAETLTKQKVENGRVVKKRLISQENDEEVDNLLIKKKSQTPMSKPEKQSVKPVRRAVPVPEKKIEKKAKDEMLDELDDIELPDLDFSEKPTTQFAIQDNSFEEEQKKEVVKKKRGRPRKTPVDTTPKPKGKRGRPRKKVIVEPVLEEKDEEIDVFANVDEQMELNSFEKETVLPDLEDNTLENQQFGDLMELDEGDNAQQFTDDIELPDLDELDDVDEFDEGEDDFPSLTEESFDEFDDYDEYGEYEMKTQNSSTKEDIDSLYEEDILSEEQVELPELEDEEYDELEDDTTDDLLSGFDEEEDTDDLLLTDFDETDGEDDLLAGFESEEKVDLLSDLEDTDDSDDALADFDDTDGEDDLLSDFEDNDEEDDLLSGFDEEEDNHLLTDFEDENETNDLLSELDDSEVEIPYSAEELSQNSSFGTADDFSTQSYQDTESMGYGQEDLQSIESPIDYSMSNLNSLMTKDKKIVTFLGSPKNGVSFLVNNLADRFALAGINTAILDMTKNRNSYYIYTQNEESLRKIAYTSMEKLQNGVAEGIRVKDNLTVYTALPNDGKDYANAEPILSSLVQNHSLVLIDCDFDTNPSYFASAQEIYLVQSMDILTIQPLTAFLRDLKTQGVLEPEKVRVVINKELKVRGLTNKAIIGGMSFYNDPAMSFMTELFNKDIVRYCSIPFEEMAYSKYLEAMLNCKISFNVYSKNFMSKLGILGDMVYPLTSSRQTYHTNATSNYGKNNFSNSMNSTLNKMKKKY